MNAMTTLFASLLLVAGPADQGEAPSRLGNFVISPIYDVRVPAREPGALIALDAEKGDVVEKGQVLGRVDDSDAQVRKIIAENELKVADTQAASDADLQASLAAIEVAKAEWEGSQKINSRVEGARSDFQIRRDRFTYERAQFQADSARVEHEVNQITRGMRMAQLQAVENEIKRRTIEAPTTGVIIERYHNVGEWAQAGEPIYRVVHMDRLRVEGMLNAADLTPEEIEAKPDMTIFVQVPRTPENPRGEIEINGSINFVSRVVDHSGEFLISADFDNGRRVVGDSVQWQVRPGLDAEAKLHPDLMDKLYRRRTERRSGRGSSALDLERIMSARERN